MTSPNIFQNVKYTINIVIIIITGILNDKDTAQLSEI
jgi:hypothetical protein